MVAARSWAMGFNRYFDRDIDSLNARTAGRMIPAGHITANETLVWSLLAGALFIMASFALSPLAGVLSLPLLIILALYSKMKHWSYFAHWYLGVCLGLAPIAVCVAVLGTIPSQALILGLAVSFWTAGFDILYATQDRDFDRKMSLHSIPARWGMRGSWRIAATLFSLMMFLLIGLGVLTHQNSIYQIGMAMIAGLLILQLWLVSDATENSASKRLSGTFLNVNASISVCFFLATLVSYLVGR
jgi:4-hydroxybenzoate polyprenyltransferase